LLALAGGFIGSLIDRGRRYEGDIRNDINSTIGIFVGILVALVSFS
jgi:hypothetical protein